MSFWYQLQCSTTAALLEPLNEALEALGALSITLQDSADEPILEPDPDTTPLWQSIKLSALFLETCNIEQLLTQLKNRFNDLQFEVQKIEEQSWENTWKDDFKATCYGDRLWVCPSWETPPQPQQPTIILDPGLAFGTGHHETTKLCLQWLAEHLKPGSIVIDYGCGSGILAIAALKLGASKVYAIDHDEQALTATIENAKRNEVDNCSIEILLPQQFNFNHADILIANILTTPLLELAETFANSVISGGNIVMSGILHNQTDNIIDKYRNWFKLCPPVLLNEWARIDGIRK